MTDKEAIGRIQEHIYIHSKKEPFTPYLDKAFDMAIEALKDRLHRNWIPLKYNDDEKVTHTYFPDELDGCWVLVTDGKRISVERIKKDIPDDHFYPAGRWFELNDTIAWMPLPKPYEKEGDRNE